MNLKLNKPLVVFDLETTGVNITKDRIIEISYIKIFPNGKEKQETIRVNPEMHIPETSTKIHHISDEDVKDCPTFKEIAGKIAEVFKDSDVAGYNSCHFDVPLLMEEMERCGITFDLVGVKHIDVQNIFHKMEQRTLVAAYKFYCGKNLEEAHSANADTMATYEVLKAQLDRYPDDLKNDVGFLAKFSRINNNADLVGRMVYNDKDEIVFNFGKYKGEPVSQVLKRDPGYYNWIMQGDFPKDTKNLLTRIKLGIPTKK